MYLLDANTFIEAKNKYYRTSICPGYWDFMDSNFKTQILASTRGVYSELEKFGDSLSDWVKPRKEWFLEESDTECINCLSDISQFVMDHKVYADTHKEKFLSGADPLIIAKAKSLGAKLVTHEVLTNGQSTRVKIPNICKEFGVEYIDTFDLLELLNVKFLVR